MLSKEQGTALASILSGHNVLICGQAGTGKTYLMRTAFQELKRTKRVRILCSTGMGCLQYFDLGATTVHSWAGLYDGRYDTLTLQDLVLNDDTYVNVRKNITEAEVVIVDEISMLTMKCFEQFETVCRKVRGNDIYFGGLQIILCGDFYQLPPVGNPMYSDDGRFCFESDIFKNAISHRIELKVVMRQEEDKLIQAVRETALGAVSDEIDTFLKSLERPVEEQLNPVYLFSLNIETVRFNNDRISQLKTEEKMYKATKNSGSEKFLRKILAPEYLLLKLNCPVILLVNLSGKLVNGLSGTVVKLEDDTIYVHFNKINQTHPIKRQVFTKFNPVKNCNVAEREQFPLVLGYGITIHKSQGMTLDSVCVNCAGIFQHGQLSVAIGRCKTSEGIFLKGYRKGLCLQPKPVITQFYSEISEPFNDSLTCCKRYYPAQPFEPDNYPNDDSDNSDFESHELELIEQTDFGEADLPTYVDIGKLKFVSFSDVAITQTQETINKLCTNIQEKSLKSFCAIQHRQVKSYLADDMAKGKTSPKDWTNTLTKYHIYITGEEYLSSVNVLFPYTKLNDQHIKIASDITLGVFKAEVENIVKMTDFDQVRSSLRTGQLPDAGKAKIRYVAGMCVAKIRNHYVSIVTSNINNPAKHTQERVKVAQQKIDSLNELVAEPDSCDYLTDKTLEEIERKQNVTRALLYINEQCFHFFLHLDGRIVKLLNYDNMKIHKSNIFEFAKSAIENDDSLKSLFVDLFTSSDSVTLMSMYEEMIYKYVLVCHKQFLKDTKDIQSVVKKKAHREEIAKRKEKLKSEVAFSGKDLLEDTSYRKDSSHMKLKLNCTANEQYLSSKLFTKDMLMKMCAAYGVTSSSTVKKDAIAKSLRLEIMSVDRMLNPELLTSEPSEPSTSSSSKKRKRSKVPTKGKGKGKGRSSVKYECKECKEEYDAGEEWIECDQCKSWYHRTCADLEDETIWLQLQSEEIPWSCDRCQKM